MSKVNVATESIIGNIDITLTDIDLAIEPDRIRHTLSSMLYIETFIYEVNNLISKVLDESIFTHQPLTRK